MKMDASPPGSRRLRCRVRGQVQGVGFRPFVYRLARELGLSGWVRNDAAGVELEVQGSALEVFLARLQSEAPPLARIDGLESVVIAPEAGEGFAIRESAGGPAATGITPDTAVCPECLAELFDPADRRYRYPFINCTHCGPRYTITGALPYDRPNTSMARFAQCPACQGEYDDPAHRRFHAQPNACLECGPRLWLADSSFPPSQPSPARGEGATPSPSLPGFHPFGVTTAGTGEGRGGGEAEAIEAAMERLRQGQILAVKGLGGFHLMCDARNPKAVARLRERKAREEKPFAVMAANLASLDGLALWSEAERNLLQSPERPIVLLRKGDQADAALPGVADGMPWLGALLPYTPIHYLLFHEAAGRPAGTGWLDQPQELLLLCTSANSGGEPLVTGNEEAINRLADIADAFLLHDRDILVRCDDSVARMKDEGGRMKEKQSDTGASTSSFILHPSSLSFQFLRRARGYTPRAVRLLRSGPSVLAAGGFFKNTVCLTRGDEAFLSQHIGELDNAATCEALEEAAAHLMAVLEIVPEAVAHDWHPDFFSTRFAARFAADHGLPAVAVQHHHAHIAAVMAEHGLDEPVIGLALDGVGLGAGSGAWGGELLRVEGAGFDRLGGFHPLALPGGDRAAQEPWRMGASALHALGRGQEIPSRYSHPGAETVAAMLERKLNTPMTSSCGRLFDAAVGLLGVKDVLGFEGQGAMLLEGLAHRHGPVAPMVDGFRIDGYTLSFLPLLERLADGLDAAAGAALFHATLVEGLAEWVGRASEKTGLTKVALGGGCFLNAILSTGLTERLGKREISVHQAAQVPPNDGGLCLGQAWVAMNSIEGT